MSQAHVDDAHSSPHWDRKLSCEFTDAHACGFDSEEALYNWFANWTAVLDAAGFVIRTYQVPDADVHYGENGQVVFLMDSASMLDVLPLNLDPVQLSFPGM